jgi:hypothetical protein
MRDPYLTAIIEQVERSGDPVLVSLVLDSGAVVTGHVRQSAAFVELTRRDTDALREKIPRPKDEYQRYLLARAEQTQAAVETVRGSDAREGAADHITLSDVTMVWSSGDGLRVPSVRLNLDAIAGWWLAGSQPIKGSKDGSGFLAVGVSF